MKAFLRKSAGGAIILLLAAGLAMPALYWDSGVRSNPISVCFVGDAVAKRPDRVKQIQTYLKEFEYAANIRFNYLGKCPAPTTLPNGNDYHNGDIRVIIPEAIIENGKDIFFQVDVPGKGCIWDNDPENPGGSWSNPPQELETKRACLYNLKLGDDPGPTPGSPPVGNPPSSVPYLNHTLHEFGHALGLSHEHERTDVDFANCKEKKYGGSGTSFMTPYDRKSVMHYQFLPCGINGNYDNTGFSEWDKLALHILYPEDNRVAEFVGATVVRTTDMVTLQSAWETRGANMDYVANSFAWKISGNTISSTPDLNTKLASPGDYPLQVSHNDFLGRNYSYSGTIRVLTPAAYNQQIAAPVAAQLPLF